MVDNERLRQLPYDTRLLNYEQTRYRSLTREQLVFAEELAAAQHEVWQQEQADYWAAVLACVRREIERRLEILALAYTDVRAIAADLVALHGHRRHAYDRGDTEGSLQIGQTIGLAIHFLYGRRRSHLDNVDRKPNSQLVALQIEVELELFANDSLVGWATYSTRQDVVEALRGTLYPYCCIGCRKEVGRRRSHLGNCAVLRAERMV